MRSLILQQRFLAAACAISLVLSACSGGSSAIASRPVLDPTYLPSGHAAAGDVFVHLFEWSWLDIATECETHLGPKGFKAVQVSPPQEDIMRPEWWSRYQPVSYSIALSRSGTAADFQRMVDRCKAAGVDVYVDAVINHMTAGDATQTPGIGRNGSAYSKYDYPAVPYTQARGDFHSRCNVDNYQSAAKVQDCELVGLADLNTGSAAVRQRIADYLIGLAQLGVAGFRLDAAKHIQPVELNDILARVNQAVQADPALQGKPLPYFFAEVIDYGGEAVKAHDYFGLGHSSGGVADITEFRFRGVGDKFLGTNGQNLAQLNPNGTAGNQFSESAWGLMPANKAVVFLENHDTQRSGGIAYSDLAKYRLANIWMLAQPYGYPSIMSSYVFDKTTQAGRDAGPPPAGIGCATSLEMATINQWVCEHRDPAIANMIAFRRAVAHTPLLNWTSFSANAIAFSRGDQGFVVINRETTPLSRSMYTGLAAGTYCDVIGGGLSLPGVCAGQAVVVGAGGMASVNLPAMTALVLQQGIGFP